MDLTFQIVAQLRMVDKVVFQMLQTGQLHFGDTVAEPNEEIRSPVPSDDRLNLLLEKCLPESLVALSEIVVGRTCHVGNYLRGIATVLLVGDLKGNGRALSRHGTLVKSGDVRSVDVRWWE